MSDHSYGSVSKQGYFSRLKDAIGGILVGILLFVLAFPLLFWNEGRAIKTAKGLEEGAAAVVSVDAGAVDQSMDNKLVHLSAPTATDEELQDPEFNISENAVALRRRVEMYQWKEEKHTEEKEKFGGSVEKVTTYSYKRVWSSERINSSSFAKSAEHQNPASMPYTSKVSRAKNVSVGAYNLPGFFISKINDYESLPIDDERFEALPGEVRERAQRNGESIYIGENPDKPQIGDTRVNFQVVRPGGQISLIAKQVGTSFEPYTTKTKSKIELLEIGTHSAESMFEAALAANATITWLLRLAGFLMAFIGLTLIFRPLAVLASVVPFIGRVLGTGSMLVAGVIAAPLSLITIATGWIFYRPLIGIPLFLLAIGIIVFGVLAIRKRVKKNASAA